MPFSVTYPVGGVLDEIKKIHLPPGIFPDPEKTIYQVKGIRVTMPAIAGIYEAQYVVPWDCHLVEITVVCTGYFDGDFWELKVGNDYWAESVFTKELPESISFTSMYPIISANTPVNFFFHNDSGTSKTVWINLKFLHG